MRKEPERRYSSVEQMSADIEPLPRGSADHRAPRYLGLSHEQVPPAPSRGRGRRRRRCSSLIVGFAVAMYVQAGRIALERDAANAQRARADTERLRAEQVSSFLINLFEVADPEQEPWQRRVRARNSRCRRRATAAGTRCAAGNAGDPARHRRQGVRQSRSLRQGRRQLLAHAVAIQRRLYPADNIELARSYTALGTLEINAHSSMRPIVICRLALGMAQRLAGGEAPTSRRPSTRSCACGVMRSATRGDGARASRTRDLSRHRPAR